MLQPLPDVLNELLGSRVHHEQWVACANMRAHRRFDHETRGVIDLVLLADAAGAQLERRHADRERIDRLHITCCDGRHRLLNRRDGKAVPKAPALRGEHADERLPART